ncbi:MAG: dTDP-4-dehydrorhamnose reductase [Phycisphaerales bacterium]
MSTPFLLIGNSGMLGTAFERLMAHNALPCTAVDFPAFDLTCAEHVNAAITPGVRYVINCAAWTDVDGAEAKEDAASRVNATGVRLLADRCAAVGATLVTYSTDYVFSGVAASPYRVDEPRAPLNAYGRSKARGEELLEASGARWYNIRTSWLYAPWGKNFVKTIAGLLKTRPSIKVVDDQRGRPTSAEHLAATTLRLMDVDAQPGTWHVTDGGECTWCGFAREIGVNLAARGQAVGQVVACTSGEFPRPAERPAYSVLDISRTENAVGAMPDWRVNLTDVVRRLDA